MAEPKRAKAKMEKPPRYMVRLPTSLPLAIDDENRDRLQFTEWQIEDIPALQELDAQLGGNLAYFITTQKKLWVATKNTFGLITVGLWCLIYIVGYLIPDGDFVKNVEANGGWFISISQMLIPLFLLVWFVRAIFRRRNARSMSRARLSVVPAFQLVVWLAQFKDNYQDHKPSRHALHLIENMARALESAPNVGGLSHRAALRKAGVAAYRKAAYVRSFKQWLITPTALSRNDLMHEMTKHIATVYEHGWHALPDGELSINLAMNRVQRYSLYVIGVVLFGGLVTSGLWGQYLGAAQNYVVLVVALILVAVLSRLGLKVNSLQQAADVANSVGKHD